MGVDNLLLKNQKKSQNTPIPIRKEHFSRTPTNEYQLH